MPVLILTLQENLVPSLVRPSSYLPSTGKDFVTHNHVGSIRAASRNHRGSRTMGTSTRTNSMRDSNGGVMGVVGRTAPEQTPNATRSDSLEDTSGEDLGRLTPTSSQWSRGTATVSLSHLESISLSDMMHPSHDIPSSQQSPDEVYTEASRSSAESQRAVWELLEVSQQVYDELWVTLLALL